MFFSFVTIAYVQINNEDHVYLFILIIAPRDFKMSLQNIEEHTILQVFEVWRQLCEKAN